MRVQVIPKASSSDSVQNSMDEKTLQGLIYAHSLKGSNCAKAHDFRWLVKGFWRTYRKGTRFEHCAWIRPHLRGPEGAPIKGA